MNKTAYKQFVNDELNAAILNSLSLEEMLAMMEKPELFTQKKERIQSEADARAASVLAQHGVNA